MTIENEKYTNHLKFTIMINQNFSLWGKIILNLFFLVISPSIFSQNIHTPQSDTIHAKELENDTIKDSFYIEGVIIDDDGSALPGVTVSEKGTSNGTVTDSDGNFKLKTSKNVTLKLYFNGFYSHEYKYIGESKNVKINIDKKLIEFCCTNHDPGHCAESLDEMQKLAKNNNCTFK